jgi:hypothetical protein
MRVMAMKRITVHLEETDLAALKEIAARKG